MKTTIIRLITLAGLLAAAVASTSITTVAATPATLFTAQSATELVLYQAGFEDGVAFLTAVPPEQRFPFRLMASNNRTMALAFAKDSPVFAAYLYGRADAFDAIADLLGEP